MATNLPIAPQSHRIGAKSALFQFDDMMAKQAKAVPSLPIAGFCDVLNKISVLAKSQLTQQGDCSHPKLAAEARECMNMTDKDIAHAAANYTRTVLFDTAS